MGKSVSVICRYADETAGYYCFLIYVSESGRAVLHTLKLWVDDTAVEASRLVRKFAGRHRLNPSRLARKLRKAAENQIELKRRRHRVWPAVTVLPRSRQP